MQNRKAAARRMLRQRRRRRRLLLIAAMLLILGTIAYRNYPLDTAKTPGLKKASRVNTQKEQKKPEKQKEPEQLKEIHSRYALLMELKSGEVLAVKAENERMYPASLTKLMTALLTVEEYSNLDETITVPEDIYASLYAEHASLAGFEPGEQARIRDLLYGIVLPSGAECCLAVAREIDGSEEAFTAHMNEKAAQLGMKETHFENSSGLHSDNHYTTAKDMAVLLQNALENKTFREVLTARRYSTRPTDRHPEGFTFYSTLAQTGQSLALPGGEILGGKTGYTEEAGLCLASLASVNGKEYLLITAGARGNHDTEPFHVLDAKKIYGGLGNK